MALAIISSFPLLFQVTLRLNVNSGVLKPRLSGTRSSGTPVNPQWEQEIFFLTYQRNTLIF